MSEDVVQPQRHIVSQPDRVRLGLHDFLGRVVPDRHRFLLQGEVVDAGVDGVLGRADLAFDGNRIASAGRPEQAEHGKANSHSERDGKRREICMAAVRRRRSGRAPASALTTAHFMPSVVRLSR
jgi:hypothetical protein